MNPDIADRQDCNPALFPGSSNPALPETGWHHENHSVQVADFTNAPKIGPTHFHACPLPVCLGTSQFPHDMLRRHLTS